MKKFDYHIRQCHHSLHITIPYHMCFPMLVLCCNHFYPSFPSSPSFWHLISITFLLPVHNAMSTYILYRKICSRREILCLLHLVNDSIWCAQSIIISFVFSYRITKTTLSTLFFFTTENKLFHFILYSYCTTWFAYY